MRLKTLILKHFRSYTHKTYEFTKATTVLVGRNAAGKTNVLEAIYLLATGESFRAEKIEEMVYWGEEVGRVEAEVKSLRAEARVEDVFNLLVLLTRGEVQGKRAQKRLFKVNGVGRRRSDFAGNLRCVIFRPEDLEVITGSPSKRRNFLDGVLMQSDKEYTRSLLSYEKGLRRRNRLLDLIKDGETDRRALWFWDELLVRTGEVITQKRRDLVNNVNATNYWDKGLQIAYDPSIISPARLKQYEREEVAAGHTLVGPHKDDFMITSTTGTTNSSSSAERDLAKFGSRGEQRMAVLWLKMHELEYIEQQTGERPLLLLDDIFSELDEEHDRMVMGLLGKQQSVITTTEKDGRFADASVEVIEL